MDDGYAVLEHDHRSIEERFQELLRDDEAPVVQEVSELLARHTQREEAVLHPLLRRYVDGGDDLADRAVAENVAIATLLAELSDAVTAGEAGTGTLLSDLGGAVAVHVEFVEGEIFPAMRECGVDGARLAQELSRGGS